MIHKDYLELAAIASDLFEATDFMGDIVDGDYCGDIGNESAARDLENLRARIRSHALCLRSIAFGCVRGCKYANDESEAEK